MQWLLVFLAGWATSFGGAAAAGAVAPKIQSMTLEEMTARSDVIVVARVETVDGPEHGSSRFAEARVTDVWKGAPAACVTFRAGSDFVCDMSGAEVGEEVVLFLSANDAHGLRSIVHYGHGEMPMRRIEGKVLADAWTDALLLPAGLQTVPGPRADWPWLVSIEVPALKATIAELVRRN